MAAESIWCNLLLKYLLVLVNIIIWFGGIKLIAIGVIAKLQREDYGEVSSAVLHAPAIACISLGSLLFLLGILGILGALVELYSLLIIYALLLIITLLAEIGIGVFILVRRAETEEIVREQMKELIINYRRDADTQNFIDTLQADVLQCCGIDGPDDWELNEYFSCTSPSLQACSVPFSCCLPEENTTTINTQCGDGALLPERRPERETTIYTNGCYGELVIEELINDLLPLLSGIILGIIIFEILGAMLTLGLALDIRKEKKMGKEWLQATKYQLLQEQNFESDNVTMIQQQHIDL